MWFRATRAFPSVTNGSPLLGLISKRGLQIIIVDPGVVPLAIGRIHMHAQVTGESIIVKTHLLDSILDIYAGSIVEGKESAEQVGDRLVKEILAIASGKPSRSEMHSAYQEPLELYATGPLL